MNAIVLDDEKESLLTFASHAIDVPNLSLNVFSSRYEDALNYARSHKVDAAFLDIVMPGTNGVSFAKSLIEIAPKHQNRFHHGLCPGRRGDPKRDWAEFLRVLLQALRRRNHP